MNKDQIAIIFIGRSGSGKGTQAKLVKEFLENENRSAMYIGTGNHFREMMKETDHTALLVKKIYDEGGRHPDFLAITMLGNIFRFDYKEGQNVLIDGAARSLHEANVILEILNFYEFKKIKVVNIDVSHEWCVDKLSKRGRSDDNAEIFKIKHTWFENDVKPAIEYFKNNKYVDFIEVNGERTIEEISKDIISKITNG
jgi:adenylate kinase family enzyme